MAIMQFAYAKKQDAYHKQGILTASPIELIIMLYDGLRKNILLAQKAIGRSDVPAAHTALIKSQAIVSELMNSLDMKYPISKELMELYDFMLRSLQQANVKKDVELLGELIGIVTTLRDTWESVSASQRTQQQQQGARIKEA